MDLLKALEVLLQPNVLGAVAAGVAVGLVVGALPGVGSLSALALLLPLSYKLPMFVGLGMLLGLVAANVTGDSITSILFGIPGSASSQAIVLDGRAMTLRGEGARALGASFTASMMGGVAGAGILVASAPVARILVQVMGPAEILVMGLWGLSMVGLLSGRSVAKGLVMAAVGLLIGAIGADPNRGYPRWTMGTAELLDGFALSAIALGSFALPEVMEMLAGLRNPSEGAAHGVAVQAGFALRGQLRGAVDAIRNWWLVIRASIIGAIIGIIPGIGGSVVDWICYGVTVRSARDRERFGKGDVRGIIGVDGGNNAVAGGAFVTTLLFGVPGTVSAGLVLSAIIAHGIKPGSELVQEKLYVLYFFVLALALANILSGGICFFSAHLIARLVAVRKNVLGPVLLSIILAGAYAGGRWTEVVSAVALGTMCYLAKKSGWPRPPLVLAAILSPLVESKLVLSLGLYGWGLALKPYALLLGLAIVGWWWWLRLQERTREGGSRSRGGFDVEEACAGTEWLSAACGAVWAAVGIYAVASGVEMPREAAILPVGAGSVAAVIGVGVVAAEVLRGRQEIQVAARTAADAGYVAIGVLGWVVGFALFSLALGTVLGLSMASGVYAVIHETESGLRRRLGSAVAAAGVVGALLWVADRFLGIYWHPGPLAWL